MTKRAVAIITAAIGVTATALFAVAAILFVLGINRPAAAEPLPLPKTGQCPSGYRESGGYCAPMTRDAPIAVPKQGQCPSGYAQSGAYCLEMRRRRRYPGPRRGLGHRRRRIEGGSRTELAHAAGAKRHHPVAGVAFGQLFTCLTWKR
jgi:hypothetical protein